MRNLPVYAKTLILQGAAVTGSFEKAYFYSEERLKLQHATELYQFCKWIDSRIGGASAYNIDMLYAAFKNPDNTELQAIANELAEKIKQLKKI